MLRLRPRSPKHRQLLPSPCIFWVGPEARQKTYFESANAASFFFAPAFWGTGHCSAR